MKTLITALSTLILKIFRAVFKPDYFKGVANAFVTFGLLKLFAVLGLSFVVYSGSQFTLDWAFSALQVYTAQLSTINSNWAEILFMAASQLRIDDVLTNLFTAYSAAWAISTMRTGANLVSTISR